MDSATLKNAGLKVTLPRLKVINVLAEHEDAHLSAEDVYQILKDNGEDVAFATVYRVLGQLENADLVRKVRFESGNALFELNSGEHHDHIVCLRCGHVTEFVDPIIEKRQTSIAREHGFDLKDHSMVIYGECERKECPHLKARQA